ncbi:MAG: NAD(P) transhydrogenase subunit alpha [Thermoleophilaceae bacterium]|nr:NAD(P) transhydrogenase subunit alpha [Thermoleophilaceae bacterium]
MKVGVAKETVEGERRVALVPEGVAKLRDRGLEVVVEAGAGREYNLDSVYEEAGAEIVSDAEEVWSQADLVAKVRAPTEDELAHVHDGQFVVSFLAPVPGADLVKELAERGVTAVSMDAIPRITRAQSMDALSSQSSVAGYKCMLMGADALGKLVPMMTTAAGTTKAASVLVLGAGVAGLQAIAMGTRLGADVYAFDIRPETKEQIESLGATFVEEEEEQDSEPAQEEAEDEGPRPGLVGLWDELKLAFGVQPGSDSDSNGAGDASEDQDDEEDGEDTGGYAQEQDEDKQQRDQELIKARLGETDIVLTTALVPGKDAPTLLTTEMVEAMPAGSVVIDLAAEAGGNCELTQPGETVEHEHVRVIGPLDLPSGVPVHASQLYSRNVVSLISHLVTDGDDDGGGEIELDFEDEITDGAVLCHGGEIRHESVRDALSQGDKAET